MNGQTTFFRVRSRRAAALCLAAAVALGAPAFTTLTATNALARGAPESFADLAASVSDAVVNISATQMVEAKRVRRRRRSFSRARPSTNLFEEFFKRRGGPGGRGDGKGDGKGDDGPRTRRGANSLGSGFVIDASGIVITNNHVIADASEVQVIFTDGTKLKAEVVGKDSKVDIAVLRVKPDKPLKAVKFADSEKARVGDWVMAVGNPFGLGGSVTAGIISARNRNIDSGPYDNYIQTDASINKGNSGGPAVQHGRRGHRRDHRDPVAVGRLGRHRLRDAGQYGHADHRPAREIRRDPARLARRAHPERR